MTEEFQSQLDSLYLKIRNLPASAPDEFKTFGISRRQGKRKGYFNSLITNVKKYFKGFFGRMRMWNERILPACYNFPELQLAKENKLETKISNTFLRSRLEITDRENKRKLTVYSPLFSSILSYFFGSMVNVRLEEYNVPHSEGTLTLDKELQPSYS